MKEEEEEEEKGEEEGGEEEEAMATAMATTVGKVHLQTLPAQVATPVVHLATATALARATAA